MKLTRRRMIFIGLSGAVAAGALWTLQRLPDGRAVRGAGLANTHQDMLTAIAASMLGPALAESPAERATQLQRTIAALAQLIDQLPPFTRGEIAQLFDLLSLKPARALLGYSGEWQVAEAKAIAAFFEDLRLSSIALKQQAYFALHDLVFGSFYAEPSTWHLSGYQGPPKLA